MASRNQSTPTTLFWFHVLVSFSIISIREEIGSFERIRLGFFVHVDKLGVTEPGSLSRKYVS